MIEPTLPWQDIVLFLALPAMALGIGVYGLVMWLRGRK
jgi:hypothetical protein